MTDNEIIKDLQEEIHLIQYVDGSYSEHASLEMLKGCLNLINRQKERIEELEKGELSKAMTFNSDTIKRCSAEAIREFGKFLIDKADIPDYVKEMTEGENG